MIIEGDARYIPDLEFKVRIQQCFELLRKKASNEFGLIVNVVKKIKASDMSGADVENSAIDIARTTFDANVYWLASVLVHESCHIIQYMGGIECEGQEAEKQCNVVQLRTLRL